jgi:glutaredoxin
MVTPDHTCPYGLKARDLLQRSGYEVDDRRLTTRAETEAFKAQHGVATTPQIFLGGARIGGYADLRRFLGKPVADPAATTYRPVAVLFALTALMAMARATRSPAACSRSARRSGSSVSRWSCWLC